MARTWLFGLVSALLVGLAVPACAPETFTFNMSSSASGAGGAGGAGSGGSAIACEPQSTQPCYDGPMGTVAGSCKVGVATCAPDGASFGACEGQVLPSFDNCATKDDEDCDGAPAACTGAHTWSMAWGDDSQQRGWSVAIDAQGSSVVAGEFAGALGVGGLMSMGLSDVFVVKLDAVGNMMWSRAWGDAADQGAFGVAVDQALGDVFVTGWFAGKVNFGTGSLTSAGGHDIFVVKISAAGEVLWSKRFGDVGEEKGQDISVVGGVVAIGGSFQGVVDFGAGDTITSAGSDDGFVAVLNGADGSGVWDKGFGDSSIQSVSRVRVGSGGSVLMAGYGVGTVDFGDGPRSSAGSFDSYLVKFGAQGGVVWSKVLGGLDDDRAYALALDSADNVIIGGFMGGQVNFGGGVLGAVGAADAYLAKYDKAGTYVWARRYGNDTAQANSVSVDPAGNLVVAGNVMGDIDFGAGSIAGHMDIDAFIAKVTGAGDPLWAMNFGTMGGTERGNEAAAGALGEAVITGSFDSSVVFSGGKTLASAGLNDVFVAKLAP